LLEEVAGEARAGRDAEWSNALWSVNPEEAGAVDPSEAKAHVAAVVAYETARLTREREEARAEVERLLNFIRRCDTKDEIVSTGRLSELQIANARTAGKMYVEPGGGRGWVVRSSGPYPLWVGQQEARESITELRDILQSLVDLQNGCPLPKYEEDWTKTMRRARGALAEAKRKAGV
jgi:hypothetical protein